MTLKRNDLVMRSKSKIYHYDCFSCHVCNRKLLPGDEYQTRDDILFCKEDALASITNNPVTISNNNNSSNNTANLMNNSLFINNGYGSSTMSITPEHSISSSSYSPSNNSNSLSSSSSVIDSPTNNNYSINNSFSLQNQPMPGYSNMMIEHLNHIHTRNHNTSNDPYDSYSHEKDGKNI